VVNIPLPDRACRLQVTARLIGVFLSAPVRIRVFLSRYLLFWLAAGPTSFVMFLRPPPPRPAPGAKHDSLFLHSGGSAFRDSAPKNARPCAMVSKVAVLIGSLQLLRSWLRSWLIDDRVLITALVFDFCGSGKLLCLLLLLACVGLLCVTPFQG
jgi:hypothetical protein